MAEFRTRFPPYIFGDFSQNFGPTGRIFYLDADGLRSQIFEAKIGLANAPLGMFLKSTGRDDQGEVYFLASNNLEPGGSSGIVFRVVEPAAFVRGEVAGDLLIDLADAIRVLDYLFGGGELTCLDVGDVNDNGFLDLPDPISLLATLVSGGGPTPAPSPACGFDPTVDIVPGGDLGCQSAPNCP